MGGNIEEFNFATGFIVLFQIPAQTQIIILPQTKSTVQSQVK